MALMWPSCAFDNCDSHGHMNKAVAVVPLVSVEQFEPYAWVLTCANCFLAWRRQNEERPFIGLTWGGP